MPDKKDKPVDPDNDERHPQAPQRYSAVQAFREAAIIHHIDQHQFGRFTIGRRDYRTFQRLTAQRALFDPDSRGYKNLTSEIKRTYSQRTRYRLDRMPEVFTALGAGSFGLIRHHDLWISQAHFYRPTRLIQDLASIGLLFVDLDYRKVPELAGREPEAVRDLVLERCLATGIPEPTLIVASSRPPGGGLQVKWLTEPLGPKRLPKWQDCQKHLTTIFKGYAADPRARDAARELRIVSTTHPESGAIVRVVHINGGWSSPRQYGFEDLCRAIIPPKPAAPEPREPGDYPEALKAAGHNSRTLNMSRSVDLMKLADHMGWAREPGPTHDVSFLAFLTASFLAAAMVNLTADDYCAEVRAIGRRLLLPRDWAERGLEAIPGESSSGGLAHLLEIRNGRPRWPVTDEYLISRFKIPVELRRDPTFHILTDAETKERHRIREQTRRRAAGAMTREEYLDRARKRDQEIRRLSSVNKVKPEYIAAQLGCSLRTVYLALENGAE